VTTYILPIADREPFFWILSEQRTAFPAHRTREAEALNVGDTLLLYTTRGCFRNPTRDRGRIVGIAIVAERPSRLRDPVHFRDREYPIGVPLSIESLAPRQAGVELAPLISRLETFPEGRGWSARIRRAVVSITDRGATLLTRELARVAESYSNALVTDRA